MPRQKKSVTFDVPTSIPFLCHLIVERQRINRVRLSSTQNSNYVFRAGEDWKLDMATASKLSRAYSDLYEDCKKVCKEFTALMSYVARECGASMDWGSTHQVRQIEISETNKIKPEEMEKLAQSYVMDEMLFPELKVALPTDPAIYEKRYEALKSAEKELKRRHKKADQ